MNYLRFSDLRKRGIVDNWTTLRRWVQNYGFPEGIKVGPNTRIWPEDEVEAWIAGQAEGAGDARAVG